MTKQNNLSQRLTWVLLITVCVGLVILAAPTAVHAAIYYVDDADDPNNASQMQPSDCVAGATSNSGNCSLREAIEAADTTTALDTIYIHSSLQGQTMTLQMGRMTIDQPVTITGTGSAYADLFIIDGNGGQIFYIELDSPSAANVVTMEKLIMRNGGSTNGGFIWVNQGNYLTMNQCTFRDTTLSSAVSGQALYIKNDAVVTMTQCTISNITGPLSSSSKGTIYVEHDGTLRMTNSTISGNTAQQGSAIYMHNSTVELTHMTITDNTGQSTYVTDPMNCVKQAAAGAAIYIDPSGSATTSLNINNSLIINNTNTLVDSSGNPVSGSTSCTAPADCAVHPDHSTKLTATISCSLTSSSTTTAPPTTSPQVDSRCGFDATTQVATGLVLDTLTDNGGFSLTHKVGTDDTTNPAIDGVNSSGGDGTCNCTRPTPTDPCACGTTNDQTGDNTRPPSSGGDACDIGSVEDPGSIPGVCSDPKPDTPNVDPVEPDLGSHTYPTYLFVASYDWLHNFHDRNAEGRDSSDDADTDNFNKIIVTDSNLFPILTAVAGDHEFPNITTRNMVSWDDSTMGSPSVNDYFNRSVAVAPDFIRRQPIEYSMLTTICEDGEWVTVPTQEEMYQYGARSIMQWAYATDPGNHNLRRYEFQKVAEFYDVYDMDWGIDGIVSDPPPGEAYSVTSCYDCTGTICDPDSTSPAYDPGSCNPPSHCSNTCPENTWFTGDTDVVIDPSSYDHMLAPALGGTCDAAAVPDGCYENETVYWTYMHNTTFSTATCRLDDLDDLNDYIDGNGNWDGTTCPKPGVSPEYPYLEIIWDSSKYPQEITFPINNFPLTLCGNSRASSTQTLAVGINTDPADPQDSGWTGMGYISQLKSIDFGHLTGSSNRECHTFYFDINDTYDIDSDPGVQIRFRLYSLKHAGFVLDELMVGERDSAFAVKQGDGINIATRWNNITTYMELVPPESFPGYPSYTSSEIGIVGYGFASNTSFTHARNVRFKNPRDVDLYRDVFDTATSIAPQPDNGAPVYIFVADTMNSRIQVFMNATGSAGETDAEAPIRPVPVRGPNDTDDANGGQTAFESNELGKRTYLNATGPSIGLGDGRKADWRQSFAAYTAGGRHFRNITAGKGEFFYPHGVAVDQDPDTKDVYLFVADTFNHRIQVFRDTTGVTNQSMYDAVAWAAGQSTPGKHFDFQFERGWGTYPMPENPVLMSYTSDIVVGPYTLNYPKGIDVARFSNNSSYLYVVDSKNYRVLKYLITERGPTAFGGISTIQCVAGYGSDGNTFASNLTTMAGIPVTKHASFLTGGAATNPFAHDKLSAVGFLNPQDVATGYSGFYTYSAPNATGDAYVHEISRSSGKSDVGVRYLNNHMVYVTDYARNNTTIQPDRLNMRIVQFIDNLQGMNGVYLPWETEDVTFSTEGSNDNLPLSQSAFGFYGGAHQSRGANNSTGSTENTEQDDWFSDRPVGIATLAWDTITPFDMRMIDVNNEKVYAPGDLIDNDQLLRVGVRSRGFFGLPYTNLTTFTNFTAATNPRVDGNRVKRVHVFCYNPDSVFQGHTVLPSPPFTFTPANIGMDCTGYMKVIAEDKYFGHSGKSGTLLFQLQD